MKLWLKIAIAVLVVLSGLGLYVFNRITSLNVEQVTDDIHVIYGLGGNTAVLDTDEGTVIVDTMTLRIQGKRIRQEAEKLTGKPVVMVINTHYHLDHTHGNPAFEPGTRVVSTERTLHHLKTTDGDYFSGDAAALLPNEIFRNSLRLTFGNKTIQLLQPGRGHTDGDLVALFVEDGVLHAGDLYFNRHYPNIDLEAGASINEWGATLAEVLRRPFTKVIPGHGPVSDREGLVQFQEFIRQLARVGEKAAEEGWTLEETRNSAELTLDEGYEEISLIIPVGLDRKFVLGRAWEEATGNFELRE
jgi:glyoxylase-like metal-dependent hydrolase (beta-lactamase superfamily II)